MKILRAFEYVAAVMIIVGIVGLLGKVAVDQIVSAVDTKPVVASVAVYPPTEDEIAAYVAGSRQHMKLIEMKDRAEMDARSKGDR
jgi:hypothetical protein